MLVRIFSLSLILSTAACVDKTLPDWATGDYEPFDAGAPADGGASAPIDASASALDAQTGPEGSAPMFDGASAANPSDAAIGDGP